MSAKAGTIGNEKNVSVFNKFILQSRAVSNENRGFQDRFTLISQKYERISCLKKQLKQSIMSKECLNYLGLVTLLLIA